MPGLLNSPSVNILYVFSNKRLQQQRETQQFIKSLGARIVFILDGEAVDLNNGGACPNGEFDYVVYVAYATTDTDYEHAVKFMWERGEPFIIVEQDIVPTVEIINEMWRCGNTFCAAKYKIFPVSTSLPDAVYAHRQVVLEKPGAILRTAWIKKDDNVCDLYGFGCTKITPSGAYPLEIASWRDIDSRMSAFTHARGIICHLHSEVKHNHAL